MKAYDVATLRSEGDAEEDSTGVVIATTDQWQVRTTFGSGPQIAFAGANLPASNALHSYYDGAEGRAALRVASRNPERQPDGEWWYIDVNYAPVSVAQPEDGYKLVLVDYGTHEIQEDVTHNLGTGNVLTDANGKPFQQTIQAARSYPYIKIVKQEKTISRSDILDASGTLNDAQVTVAGIVVPAFGGKLRVTATEQPEKTYAWEVSWEILTREFLLSNYIDFVGNKIAGPTDVGWLEGIINQGFYLYELGGPVHKRATETVEKADGTTEERPSATPVLLDENGAQLAAGQTPLSILLQTMPSSDWSGLGLNDL